MLRRGPSLLQRLLGGAVVLLVAAYALHWAVELVLSIIWPLAGMAAAGLLLVVGFRVWQANRDRW